jgi:polysaccharide pyruvyl transferase WcaK-like protein
VGHGRRLLGAFGRLTDLKQTRQGVSERLHWRERAGALLKQTIGELDQHFMCDIPKVRVVLLGATFETQNLGVNALAAGAIKCVLSYHPHADIKLLEYSKKRSVHILRLSGMSVSIPLVNMRFSKKVYLPNNIALLLLIGIGIRMMPFAWFRKRLIARNECLRQIEEADIVASISGGDSFSDVYGLLRMLYVSLPQVLVLLLRKRLILLPQTIGPFRHRISKRIARYILSRAEHVYSRDYRGVEEVRGLLGKRTADGKTIFCYDMGFVVDAIGPDHLDIVGLESNDECRRPIVGLNISGLLVMGGYSRSNMFGLRVNYLDLIQRLIDYFICEKRVSVLLVPHVLGDDPGSESDKVVCEKLYGLLKDRYRGRLGWVKGQYNESETKYVIGKCDFFIGSRMHACIAAVSQYVPSVCVAYSDKFIGVMETLGVSSIVADARMLSIEGILALAAQSYDQRDGIRRELERRMPEVRATVLDLFRDVHSGEEQQRKTNAVAVPCSSGELL